MKIVRPIVFTSAFVSAYGSLTRNSTAFGSSASSAHLRLERATDTKLSAAPPESDHKPWDIWDYMSWESYDAERELQADMAKPKSLESTSTAVWINRLLWQLLFGLMYYFLIVSKYPAMPGHQVSEKVAEYKKQNVLQAFVGASPQNIVLSICCTGARAAHTFKVTGALSYWPGLILMSVFPCCTLMFAESYSDMPEKLGGEKRSLLQSALCACCCSFCVIAQDAHALDMATNAQTGFFQVHEC